MNNLNKFRFIGQKEGEEILLLVRRHWFNMFIQFLMIAFAVILLIVIYAALPVIFPFFASGAGFKVLIFLASLFMIFIWMLFSLIWIDYYFDIWIITNKRIINIEQKGLFIRHVSELAFKNIQDVTTEVTGFIPTVLNYGDVFIQTAAEKERFIFKQVPGPYKIKDLIMNLQKKQFRQKEVELGQIIQEEIHKEI